MKNMKVKKPLIKRVIATMLTVAMALTFTMSNMFPVNTAEAYVALNFHGNFSGRTRLSDNNYSLLVQPENYAEHFLYPVYSERIFNALKNEKTWIDISNMGTITQNDYDILSSLVYDCVTVYCGRGISAKSFTVGYSGGKPYHFSWDYDYYSRNKIGTTPKQMRKYTQEYLANNGGYGMAKSSKYRINSSDSQLTKIKKIYNYTCTAFSHCGNVQALEGALAGYEICDIVTRRTGCCQDYANVFEMLCNYYGIRCQCIFTDFARTNGITGEYKHMFNMVELNGKWYIVDCTKGAHSATSDVGDYTYLLTSIDASLTYITTAEVVVRELDYRDWGYDAGTTNRCFPSNGYASTTTQQPIGAWYFPDIRYTGYCIPNMDYRYPMAREIPDNWRMSDPARYLANEADRDAARAYWGVN